VKVAVAGAGGRLGSALLHPARQRQGWTVLPWGRPTFDLDDLAGMRACLARDTPDLVLMPAAWTDVDGCARDPELAMARNGQAPGVVAEACVAIGARLVLISTNEVFDGERTDGRGYREDDPVGPRNPYGASKLAGERAAQEAFDGRSGLWIIRTSWLFGPHGNDFPHKVIAAADLLPTGAALPGVADEQGRPTFAPDLAVSLLDLVERTSGGVFHLANEGVTSRLGWAEWVLAKCRPGRAVRPVSRDAFPRSSDPPRWGVLDTQCASALGVRMRAWPDATQAYIDAGR
jgi:dTDP-4-dehydrorhamnose reductase